MPFRCNFARLLEDRKSALSVAILTTITLVSLPFAECDDWEGTQNRLGAKAPCGTADLPQFQGQWEPVSLEAPSNISEFHKLAGYQCGDISLSLRVNTGRFLCGYLSEEDVDRAFEQFAWQWNPAECSLPSRFGAELETLVRRFLRRVEGSRLVFIGDSFAYEQFLSLRCLLGKDVVLDEGHGHFTLQHDTIVQVVDSPYLVDKVTLKVMQLEGAHESVQENEKPSSYVDNDRLQKDFALSLLEDVFNWDTYDNPSGVSYAHHVTMPEAILVLNTGPHWHGNMTGYGTMVMNVLHYLQRHFQGKRIFVRASSHGHKGCEHVSHPQMFQNDANQRTLFNWRMLEHYNAIWKYEIDRLNDDRFVFLDISPMSAERADSHSISEAKNDCLHYCLPGIVDYWNMLLMSYVVHS